VTDQQIYLSIDTNERQLTNRERFSHYSIVFYCFLISAAFFAAFIKKLVIGDSKRLLGIILLFMLVPSIIGLLFYKLQKTRLKFKTVETNLPREELDKIIERVAAELQWRIYTRNK